MFHTRILLFLFLAIICQASYCHKGGSNVASVGENANSKMWMFRLPNSSIPQNYSLRIISYPTHKEPHFKGRVQIYSLIRTETDEIILHSKNLNIDRVYMGCTAKFSLDSINEILRIEACRKLVINQTVLLTIDYYGSLNQSSVGIYASAYRVKSSVAFIVATQFKPTFARMAFPCYDEPQFKARFTLSIGRTYSQRSISNMRLITTDYDYSISPSVWDRYEQSPPMATHSLAFAIFEYQCEDSSNRTRTCTRENAVENAFYIKNIANRALTYMEVYTDQKFHLPRLNFATLPENYFAVLENWGLITFRESYMLFDEQVSSQKDLEACTLALCRGIARQWFGNYLTSAWWDNVWLNEGIASYFQLYLADQVYPSWRIKDSIILQTLQPALFADQVRIHHPLNVKVNTPREINNVFDTISYRKGAAVMRMLEHIVSPELFQKSMRQYLRVGWNENHGIVTPELLWRIFDEKLKEFGKSIYSTVSEIMNTWISTPGYPIVYIDRVTSRSAIKIYQIPFSSPRSVLPFESSTGWIVPITYTRQSTSDFDSTTTNFWLLPSHNKTNWAVIKDSSLLRNEWIIFNIRATGYYRVNYDFYNWKLLSLQLHQEHEKIHVLNRAQLVDDSVALAVDEYLPYSVPFELMLYLDKEYDMIPWFSAFSKFNYLYSLYESTHVAPLLRTYILHRIDNIYKRIGFTVKPGDDHLTRTARSAVVEMACRLDMPECLEEAVTRYHKHSVNLNKISPDIKKAVLCSAVKSLTKEPVWINIWNAYRKSNVAHEKEAFLYALGCPNNEELLKRYLYQLTCENDLEIRRQDYGLIFGAIFNRAIGVNAGLQMIYQLLPSMGNGILSSRTEDIMVRMLHFMKPTINTENQVEMVKNLIMEAEQWDDGMSKNFMNALYSAHEAGLHQLRNRDSRMNSIAKALGDKTDLESPSSGYLPSPSAAPILLIFIIRGYLWITQ